MTKRKRIRGNGEGSIIQLGGNRKKPFAVRITVGFTEEGKQIYKYLSYHSKITEAKEALRNYLVDPYDLSNKNITLYEVFEKFIATNPASENTIKNYKTYIKKCSILHKKPIRNIKIGDIETVFKHLTPVAQKHTKSVLNRVFKYALKYDIISKNIIEFVETDPVQSKPRGAFTKEQVQLLLNYDKHPLAYTLKLLLYSGMRINELLDIETKNVHLEEGYIIGGNKTKAGKDRIIPIHNEIKPLVTKIYNPDHKYLVVTPFHKRKISYNNYLAYFWDNMRKDLNLTQSPHSTRYTFTTTLLEGGADRVAVQRIIGHKNMDITDRYTDRNIERLKEEINKLAYN